MAIDLREYLAAERTLLAYVRTAIAIMGIGFVVARFNLMLRMMAAGVAPAQTGPHGHALWLGTSMVVFGGAVSVVAGLQYRGQVRELNEKLAGELSASWLALSMAFGLGVIGLVMAAYLLETGAPVS